MSVVEYHCKMLHQQCKKERPREAKTALEKEIGGRNGCIVMAGNQLSTNSRFSLGTTQRPAEEAMRVCVSVCVGLGLNLFLDRAAEAIIC